MENWKQGDVMKSPLKTTLKLETSRRQEVIVEDNVETENKETKLKGNTENSVKIESKEKIWRDKVENWIYQ